MDITRQRLYNQGLLTHPFRSPEEVVRWLGAVQAQEYAPSLWALGVRMQPAVTEGTVVRAIESGKIIRTWLMRGTIHYAAAEDVAWMVRLLASRVNKKYRLHYDRRGATPEVLSKGKAILLRTLAHGGRLTRKELYEHFHEAGIDTGNMLGVSILQYWAQEGLVCFGSNQGKQPTIALLDDWAPGAQSFSQKDALKKLTLRYFTSHGPATAQDFAWWSGLTSAEVRHGLELAQDALASEQFEGRLYWHNPATGNSLGNPGRQHVAFLLPCFDEYTVGYKDRSAAMAPTQLKSHGYAVNYNNIVVDGRIVGSWKPAAGSGKTLVNCSYIGKPSSEELNVISVAAKRYTSFALSWY